MSTFACTGRWWRRTAGPSLAAITMLGLATAAALTTFGVADGVVWRSLPYRAPHELMAIVTMTPAGEAQVSLPDFLALRDGLPDADLAAASPFTPELALTGHGLPRTVRGRLLSADYFSTLGVTLAAGRDFNRREETPGVGLVTILTSPLRRQLFAGLTDTETVGRSLTLNGRPHLIVGVLPDVHDYLGAVDVYVPIQFPPTLPRRLRLLSPVARTATEDRAAFINGLSVVAAAPDDPDAANTRLTTHALAAHAAAPHRQRLLLLAGAALLLVAIAGVNFVVFLAGRIAARRQEIAVRLALGARLSQVRTLVYLDVAGLCLMSGVAGLILTSGLQPALATQLGIAAPHAAEIHGRVALAVGLLLSVVCGVALAATAGLRTIGGASRNVTASQHIGRLLVVVQVALSVTLVVTAALLIRRYTTLERHDPGFETRGRMITRLSLPNVSHPTGDDRRRFWSRLLEELRSEGISAAITTELPLTGELNPTAFNARTESGEVLPLEVRSVSEDFFDVMEMPILEGRGVTRHDDERGPTVVVVNERLAARLAPSGRPLGQKLAFDFGGGPMVATVVGIVANVRHTATDTSPLPESYFAFRQTPLPTYSLVVASTTTADATSERVTPVIRRLDPLRPIRPMKAYADVVTEGLSPVRGEAGLLSGFAVSAVVVASTGLYSLLLLFVTSSRREWVIRLALGATPQELGRHVLRRAAIDSVAGGAIGMVLCLLLWSFLRARLSGLFSVDWFTVTVSISAVIALTTLAAAGPVRAARRISAAEVLRSS